MPLIPEDPSAITAGWLSEVLDADVSACKVEQIAIGVGLLGRLFRVHLEGGPDVPETVVVKLPTLDVTARVNLCEELEFYLREVRFYQEIGLTNPLRPAQPYFAAFDDATHDFVLVLEDLGRLRNVDQLIGCTPADAATVIDAIARHHGHWWANDRLSSLHWLKPFTAPPFTEVIVDNYRAAWPKFLELAGSDLSPLMRRFGERFTSLMPWLIEEFSREPHTFLHGDLRLDQLFFAVEDDDPPVTVLDWQITGRGRGAWDLSYFLSQSLTPETRRDIEDELIARYARRLAKLGIEYPSAELQRDYRLTTAWCFIYPVMASGRIEVVNERNMELARTMLSRSVAAMEDHDCLSLRPD
ncbi:phosphotransferase [Mycolicibacterium tusciae]|uniref:Phosphotransferase n=1 Tax=Mycolicibacterium tusciae TaxID=75922 RepID=A0A1X0K144_9MYCO|nr:phosphotransferase [Mycolicibacterium tusciae]ORB68821.1 phosphotransferase [Mycolicibacterium tusciae]